jgi:hypothetical protein
MRMFLAVLSRWTGCLSEISERIAGFLLSIWCSLRSRATKAVGWLRVHLHWNRSGAIVGVLGGFVGQVLMSSGGFIASETCFGISGLILVLWAISCRGRAIFRLTGAVFLLAGTLFVISEVEATRIAKIADARRIKLEANFGTLEPAHDPNPVNNQCMESNPNSIFTVLFGSNTISIARLPVTIVNIAGIDYFVLSRSENGTVTLSVSIPDTDGRIIAKIDQNSLHINPNRILDKERPDESTLIVRDEFGRTVLRVRYNNASYMTISGILNYQGRIILAVDGSVRLPFDILTENCFGGAGVGRGVFAIGRRP